MNIKSKIPVMSYRQYRWARKLVHECCNYDNGNCIALDDGEECICVQSISYSLLCKWFRTAVLPIDKPLETTLLFRDDFTQEMLAQDEASRKAELAQKRKTLSGAQKRMEELDKIIQRLYEDSVLGRLSNARYMKLSAQYEAEQAKIGRLAKALEQETESEAEPLAATEKPA